MRGLEARKEGLQYLALALSTQPESPAWLGLSHYVESYREEAQQAGAAVDEALMRTLEALLESRKP